MKSYISNNNFILYLFIFLFFNLKTVNATHIVGGEINYRCLGNNMYEISLRVFRDCDTGVPWFDNPASIGVFDANNVLIYDLRLNMRENDTLDLQLNDPCLVAPPNVCIHTTSYVDTVSLPFIAGGYQLVYQRCCRNQDIVNIVNPLGTGATYYCLVTEEALLNCNNSAVFNSWPPVYICVNRPIFFNHSATDADGDSLVYEMCTPLDGATPFDPMPQPPYNPPYVPVNWLPNYGPNNMLGGIDSLRINYASGLLQGTPTQLGVYVVGICVSEYRNGQLISTSRRDFQYAIGVCGRLVSSAFFAPQIQCDNSLQVQFQNSSTSLGTGYIWYFGDSTTNATSTLEDPVYIYPDTGTYIITLIADPGSLCTDTSIQTINLQYESIIMDFDVAVTDCSDTVRLQITDLTVDTISTITNWSWTFGNGLISNVPFANTFYTQSGTYPISLTVQAANGCSSTLSDTISFEVPDISSADTVAICPGQNSIVLNPGGDTTHVYQWSPATGLSGTNIASPIASPGSSTTYFVTVTAFNGIDSCVLQKSVTVIIAPPIFLQPLPDTSTCNDTLFLGAVSSPNTNINWSFNGNFNPIFSNQNPGRILLPVFPSGVNVFVRATDAYGCSVRDTLGVSRLNIPITPDFTFSYLACSDSLRVQFTDQTTDFSQGGITNWFWEFGNSRTSSLQNPVTSFGPNSVNVIRLSVLTAQGCTGTIIDTISFLSAPVLNGSDSVGICPGNNSVLLNPNANPTYSYQWAPATGLNNTTIPSPIASPSVRTFYTVTITSQFNGLNCTNVDTILVDFPPPVIVNAPNQTYCGNQLVLTASSNVPVSYQWSINSFFSPVISTSSSATVTPPSSPFNYFVMGTDAFGCSDTAVVNVIQTSTALNVNFTINPLLCSDSLVVRFDNTTVIPPGATVTFLRWNVVGPSFNQISSLNNPTFVLPRAGSYTITLNITLSNGCRGTFSQVIDLNLPLLTSLPTIGACNGASSVVLNPNGDTSGVTYNWSPSASLSNPTAASPIATPTSFPAVYQVTITAANRFGNCTQTRQVTIVQPPPISISIPSDTTFCVTQFLAYCTPSLNIVRWEWSTDPLFNSFFLVNANPISLGFGTNPFTYNIYLRGFDQYGCTVVDTGVFRFTNLPVPVIAAAVPMGCDDDSLVIQYNDITSPANGNVTVRTWNFGNGNSSSAQNPSLVYAASDSFHIYSLFIRLNNGCQGIFRDTLDYLVPNFVDNDSVSLCGSGSTITLNPNGNQNLLYQWSPATGLSNPNIANPVLTPSGNITYTVTITAPNNGDTCVAIHDFTVNTDSFVINAVEDTLICENRVNLYVNSNSPVVSTEWALDRNFNLIMGSGNPFFTYVNTNRMFYVRARNAFGCVAVDSVMIRVRNTPIDVNFDMLTLDCTDSLLVNFRDLTADTTYSSLVSWQWNFGDGNFSNSRNPIHTYAQSGNYQVSLSVQNTSTCAGQLSLPLNFNLPQLANWADTLISCGAAPIVLNPGADTSLLYQWSPAVGISNVNSPSPTVNLNNSQQIYTVTISSPISLGALRDTCQLTASMLVIAAPFPTISISGDSVFCDSFINILTSTNSTGNIEWSDNSLFNNIISTADTLNFVQTALNQMYFVRITDNFGCSGIDSFAVRIRNTPLNVLFDFSIFSCSDSLTLNFRDLTTDTIPFPINIRNWNFGDGTQSNLTNPVHSYTQSGTYNVTLQLENSAGCTGVLNLPLNLTLAALANSTDSVIVCNNQAVRLNEGGDSNLIYQWIPAIGLDNPQSPSPFANPQTSQIYVVNITTLVQSGNLSDSCTVTDTIVVIVPPQLTVEAIGDTIICDDNFNISAIANQTARFSWSNSLNFNPVLSNQAVYSTVLNFPSQELYVRATDRFGCGSTDSITIYNRGIEATIDTAAVSCPGQPAIISVVNNNSNDILSYAWNPDSLINQGQGTNSIVITPDSNAQFIVYIQNQFGCADTLSSNVSVYAVLPFLEISATPDTVFIGETTQLIATPDNNYQYSWQSSNTLSALNINNPTASPTENTRYVLTITDISGCRNTDSIMVYIKTFICDEPYVFIPNTFTPDGDGLNDLLFVRGNVITELFFAVYNRWGEKVFETDDQNIGWNGTFRGEALSPDVYGYYLRYKCFGSGNTYQFKKGNVTLMK